MLLWYVTVLLLQTSLAGSTTFTPPINSINNGGGPIPTTTAAIQAEGQTSPPLPSPPPHPLPSHPLTHAPPFSLLPSPIPILSNTPSFFVPPPLPPLVDKHRQCVMFFRSCHTLASTNKELG